MLNPSVEDASYRRRRTILILAVLLLGTGALFRPVRNFEFLNFDDPSYVTANPAVLHGLTLRSFLWAFTSFYSSNWHPLTWLSHMLDCQLFGEQAGFHHIVNVLLHALNAGLLFSLLSRTTRAPWRSAIVAALFAWHPLHIESVAWVSERKDVLSTLFGLLSLWWYVRYVEESKVQSLKSKAEGKQKSKDGGRKSEIGHQKSEVRAHVSTIYYALALFCFALSLLSKSMLITLPFILLLFDYWPLRRGSRPALREKLPFFALSGIMSVLTFLAQSRGGSVASAHSLPLVARMENALVSYQIYLEKMLWPRGLACFYPFQIHLSAWRLALAAGVLLLISGFVAYQFARARYLVVGWLWYLGTLIPVIGLVQVGLQSRADRYTYLPLVGIFIMLVWGMGDLVSGWTRRKAPSMILGGSALVGCLVLSSVQIGYWKESETLFAHAVSVCPEATLSHHNLGHAWLLKGRYDDAISEFAQALRIDPTYAQAEFNWGNALRLQGKLEDSIPHYTSAMRLRSNYPEAAYQLANTLTLQGKFAEAGQAYAAALRMKPGYPEAHNNLGNLYELGGKTALAMDEYQTAVSLNPDYAEGHYYWGAALARQKKTEEALAHFQAAIRLQPDYALALNDLAWIFATTENPKIRDVAKAIGLAERACAATHQRNVNCLDTLATVYALAGRFPEAAQTAEHALTLAREAGQTKLVIDLENRLKDYRAGSLIPRNNR